MSSCRPRRPAGKPSPDTPARTGPFPGQTAAPEAFNLRKESDATLKLYGLERGSTEGFAWQCLIARRLAERGVRFIELIDGDTQIDKNWDAHAKMSNYNALARNVDQPIAGLIRDLKSRGMLDETLVVWTTEFGRQPFCPNPNAEGRGHHSRNYCSWLAGGGIRGGVTHGPSDQWGYKPLDRSRPTYVYDVHATILHLLGIDHTRLTVRHDGIDRRLTELPRFPLQLIHLFLKRPLVMLEYVDARRQTRHVKRELGEQRRLTSQQGLLPRDLRSLFRLRDALFQQLFVAT